MKIWSKILTFIAAIIGMISADINIFGINEYKKELIIGLLGIVFIDYSFSMIQRFRKYTFIQTKFDWIFRLANLIVGSVAIGFLILNWIYFFDFGWILLIFGFLGLTSGIIYQNSIQIRKKTTELIIKYKHRNEKTISNPESLIYEKGKITIRENDRCVEIYDLKNTEKNKSSVIEFFRVNYPKIEIEIK